MHHFHATQTPHVSAALVHLRRSVTALCVVAALCLTVQTLVFAFVHFTDARWTIVEPDHDQPANQVVTADKSPAPGTPPGSVTRRVKISELEPPKVLSRWDGVMREFSSVASSIGAMVAVLLAVQAIAAVAVAGGGGVPGVDRVVSASTWAMVLALSCLPWNDIFRSVPFAGLLSGYDTLLNTHNAVRSGELSDVTAIFNHVVFPIAGIPLAFFVAWSFREGVRAGIIVTSVSELDARVEEELADLKSRGIGSNFGPRSVGALHTAIGERPASPLPGMPPAPANQRPIGVPALENLRDSEQEAVIEALAKRAKPGAKDSGRRPI